MLALLVPAAAQAKPQKGAVLRVDRAHHKVEVVNSAHLVPGYSVVGNLSSKLRSGALVTLEPIGKRVNGCASMAGLASWPSMRRWSPRPRRAP